MKKILLSLTCLLVSLAPALAQPPSVSSGALVLQLDLNSGAGAANYDPVTHTWYDLTSNLNHVSQPVAANAPTPVTVAGFNALDFDASVGQFLSNTSAAGLSNPQSTIFVVRVADPAASMQTSISLISQTWDTDEMLMSSGASVHHTWSGNFYYKEHPCYSTTPSDKPVVMTGVFRPGLTSADLDLYVNNVFSTNTITSHSSPLPYYPVPRDIYIGKRLLHSEFMDGQIMEILVYDADLSAADVSLVNDYLKCKYNTNVYADATCNPTVSCPTAGSGCSDSCFWKVTGNNIIGGNNVFGTTSNNDILVKTNSLSRGTMTKDGRWSWNTVAPTTTMHFYDDGNSRDRFGAPSGLRLENLPSGSGNILVVDAQGYVYVSKTTAKLSSEKGEIEELKREIALLKQQMALYAGSPANPSDNKLFVYPNPVKTKLNVTLMTTQQLSAKEYTVTDMQGRVILSGQVAAGQDKSFSVNTSSLATGSYIISVLNEGIVLGREPFIIQ